LRTVERVLEKLDEYQDKADRSLLIDVPIGFFFSAIPEPERYSQPGGLHTEIFLGYDNGHDDLDCVSVLMLKYDKRGMGKGTVSPESPSSFTGSEQSFALIKRCLQTCYTEHRGCCSNSTQSKPTRLLDLGTRDADDIRLVAGSTIGHVPYAALSYCWGSSSQLELSSKNESELERRIPIETLSRVAQEAATVCRGLSIRYLWIDAICIMQGSDGDFHQEAARMEEVYASALFTICAGASEDSTQSFLVHRDPLLWTQCHLFDDDSREAYGYASADYCENMKDVPGGFVLDHRGWCFQEQFLSPRSIYFGPKGVHWICREGTVCDRYPDFEGLGGLKDHDGLDWESPKQLYDRLVSLGDDISDPRTNLDLCKVWRDIRQDYSLRKLRYQSDKLLALAGVASIIQRKFDVRASFGLWLEVFHEELLWVKCRFPTDDKTGTRLDIAPSWSWASLGDCEIDSSVNFVLITGSRLLNSVLATIILLPPVTGFTIPLRDSGSGCKTYLRLSGRLTACVQHHEQRSRLDPKDYPSGSTQSYGDYFPDTDLEEKDIYCFLIKRDLKVFVDRKTGEGLDSGSMEDCCLVLTPVPGSDHRFRRVGVYIEPSLWYRYDGGAPSIHPYMFHREQEEQEIEII
jgi:hypothetical protein